MYVNEVEDAHAVRFAPNFRRMGGKYSIFVLTARCPRVVCRRWLWEASGLGLDRKIEINKPATDARLVYARFRADVTNLIPS